MQIEKEKQMGIMSEFKKMFMLWNNKQTKTKLNFKEVQNISCLKSREVDAD